MNERSTLFWDAPERSDRQFVTRDCPYCDGLGRIGWGGCSRSHDCEECDGTGKKYRAVWTTDDGVTCSMTGSGATPPDANIRAVMEMIAGAALDRSET